MNSILKLKHWQLFGLMIGAGVIGAFSDLHTNKIALAISNLFLVGIYISWLWAMCINLYTKLPSTASLNLGIFKLCMLIPSIYILILSFLFSGDLFETQGGNLVGFATIIIPVHLCSAFCIFWCLTFVAKSLKAAELQRPVTFRDYVGEFFLFWFFPIGVWFIQPRINKMFEESLQAAGNI